MIEGTWRTGGFALLREVLHIEPFVVQILVLMGNAPTVAAKVAS